MRAASSATRASSCSWVISTSLRSAPMSLASTAALRALCVLCSLCALRSFLLAARAGNTAHACGAARAGNTAGGARGGARELEDAVTAERPHPAGEVDPPLPVPPVHQFLELPHVAGGQRARRAPGRDGGVAQYPGPDRLRHPRERPGTEHAAVTTGPRRCQLREPVEVLRVGAEQGCGPGQSLGDTGAEGGFEHGHHLV